MNWNFPLSFVFLTVLAIGDGKDFNCKPFPTDSKAYTEPVCYNPKCTNAIQKHIQEELNAAFNYLFMAVYFDQDSVNRPGLATFLYDSASEERQHAVLMLDYLNSRGTFFDIPYSIGEKDIIVPREPSYRNAIETALQMEIMVTDAIYKVIKDCDSDFQGADMFTNPVLEEQHSGIRKLQGMLKTFDNMAVGYSEDSDIQLAEYLFDKKQVQNPE